MCIRDRLYLALLDGAHNTDDVGEHLIRGIRLQGIILAPMGNICLLYTSRPGRGGSEAPTKNQGEEDRSGPQGG